MEWSCDSWLQSPCSFPLLCTYTQTNSSGSALFLAGWSRQALVPVLSLETSMVPLYQWVCTQNPVCVPTPGFRRRWWIWGVEPGFSARNAPRWWFQTWPLERMGTSALVFTSGTSGTQDHISHSRIDKIPAFPWRFAGFWILQVVFRCCDRQYFGVLLESFGVSRREFTLTAMACRTCHNILQIYTCRFNHKNIWLPKHKKTAKFSYNNSKMLCKTKWGNGLKKMFPFLSSDQQGILHFVPHQQMAVNVLSITLIGSQLDQDPTNQFILATPKELMGNACRSIIQRKCRLVGQRLMFGKYHYDYQCSCHETIPCDINLISNFPGGKELCDIILSSQLILDLPWADQRFSVCK